MKEGDTGMVQQKPDDYYTTQAVATLFVHDDLRQEFMAAYNAGPSQAQAFLENTLHMPSHMAKEIVTKTGDDLNNFVGKRVCTYLW